jgi:hypothetical protein
MSIVNATDFIWEEIAKFESDNKIKQHANLVKFYLTTNNLDIDSVTHALWRDPFGRIMTNEITIPRLRFFAELGATFEEELLERSISYAARIGNLSLVKYLHEECKQPPEHKGDYTTFYTVDEPIYEACDRQHLDIVEYLLPKIKEVEKYNHDLLRTAKKLNNKKLIAMIQAEYKKRNLD